MIGSMIGRYRISALLGQGGMGEVFLAQDTILDRPVALKVLRHKTGSAKEGARFHREARAAAALSHPGIAILYDAGECETSIGVVSFLAMEFVPGMTLSARMAHDSVPLDEVLDLMRQAADALAYAHQCGVVHTDVKPANLMVCEGRLKVLDFGLAQRRTGPVEGESTLILDATVGTSAAFAGTPHYMSPEQALGLAIDARSDVFSLGVVFYELLAGRRPFEGETFIQIADAVIHHDPAPLHTNLADPRLPDIQRLVSRMLAKDASARPADLREVATRLFQLRSGNGVTAAGLGLSAVTHPSEEVLQSFITHLRLASGYPGTADIESYRDRTTERAETLESCLELGPEFLRLAATAIVLESPIDESARVARADVITSGDWGRLDLFTALSREGKLYRSRARKLENLLKADERFNRRLLAASDLREEIHRFLDSGESDLAYWVWRRFSEPSPVGIRPATTRQIEERLVQALATSPTEPTSGSSTVSVPATALGSDALSDGMVRSVPSPYGQSYPTNVGSVFRRLAASAASFRAIAGHFRHDTDNYSTKVGVATGVPPRVVRSEEIDDP